MVLFTSLWTLLLLSPLSVLASTTNYTLQHRFLPHPSSPPPRQPGQKYLKTPPVHDTRWIDYGTIIVDTDGTPLGHFVHSGNNEGVRDDGKGWYQLALDVEGEKLITSTKSCYTAAPQQYTFILNLPDLNSPPTSIDLKLSYLESDGSCPRSWYEEGEMLFLPKGIATGVEINLPQHVTGPSLAPPPVVDNATGKVKMPEPEKSFLQKYWLPLIGIGFFAVSMMAPEEPKRGGGGGGAAK